MKTNNEFKECNEFLARIGKTQKQIDNYHKQHKMESNIQRNKMKTRKLLTFVLLSLLLLAPIFLTSGKYKITNSEKKGLMYMTYVERKGDTLQFVSPMKMQVGDSITLYVDYDFNYTNIKKRQSK